MCVVIVAEGFGVCVFFGPGEELVANNGALD